MLTVTFMLQFNFIFGQQLRPMVNYPTPNISDLGTFGQIPVSLYTGVPDISIPIYEIKEGPIVLPIKLNYHTYNIRPNSHPGWIGLGWSLTTGGYITRSVRGFYDEQKDSGGNTPGFYSNYEKLKSVTDATSLIKHTQKLGALNEKDVYELTADEFSFSFGHYSGKFYLNENGGWSVVSDHKIKVEFDSDNGFISLSDLKDRIDVASWARNYYNTRYFNEFTLVTPDGCRYTFGGVTASEYSISYYNRNNSNLIPTTWYLTKATTPDKRTVIYEYEVGDPICDIKLSPNETSGNDGECGGFVYKQTALYPSFSGYLIFPVYLKTIKSSYAEVQFVSSQDNSLRPLNMFMYWKGRKIFSNDQTIYNIFDGEHDEPEYQFHVFMKNLKDIPSNIQWRKLDNIILKLDKRENRTFHFDYKIDGQIWSDKRLKLMSLKESVNKLLIPDSEEKIYSFSYNTTLLPDYCYALEDHWGFNKGKNPDIQAETRFGSVYYDSRDANGVSAKAEVLTEIKYPTGGKTVFEFESNNYSQCVKPSLTELEEEIGVAGGLRISKITSYDSENKFAFAKMYYYTKEKYPTNSNSSGILKYKPFYTYTRFFGSNKYWIKTSSAGGDATSGTNRDSYISYSSVIEDFVDENNKSKGYIRYTFSNYDKDIWDNTHMDEYPLYSNLSDKTTYISEYSSNAEERGKLMSEEYYNEEKKLVKKIENKYNKVLDDYIKTAYQEVFEFPCNVGICCAVFKTYLYSYLLSSTAETMYDPTSENRLQKKTIEYEYNHNKLLASQKIYSQENVNQQLVIAGVFETRYKYIDDYLAEAPPKTERPLLNMLLGAHAKSFPAMSDLNIISYPVEKSEWRDPYLISSNFNFFKMADNQAIISEEYYMPHIFYYLDEDEKIFSNYKNISADYKKYVTYSYDSFNNIRQTNWLESGETITYIWGYKYFYPIVEIRNATFDEVAGLLGGEAIINSISAKTEPSIEDWDKLAGLREKLPSAQVTIRTYKPLIGVSSVVNPQGIPVYYKYDPFNRLQYIEDKDRKIIESYGYHYQNQ